MSVKSEGDVKAGYDKYLKIYKKLTTISSGRCFAVEPSENQPDLVVNDLVMIPDQITKLDLYIETLLNDLVAELFKIFEKKVQNPKSYILGYENKNLSNELQKKLQVKNFKF
jgi:hypothetical protein